MSVITNLRNAFAGVAAVTLSGCATVSIPTGGACIEGNAVVAPLGMGAISSQRYNKDCGQTMAGNQMVEAGAKRNDAPLTAVGILTLEASNPAIRQSGDRVREALANQGEQSYTVRRMPDGTVRLIGTPIVTVPRREAAQPATGASAPVPTP